VSLRVGSGTPKKVPEESVQLKRKSEAPLVASEKVTLSVTEYMLGLTKVVTAWAEKVRVVKSKTTDAEIKRGKAEDPYIKACLVRVGDLSNGEGRGEREFCPAVAGHAYAWIFNFGFWTLLRSVSVNLAELRRAPSEGGFG